MFLVFGSDVHVVGTDPCHTSGLLSRGYRAYKPTRMPMLTANHRHLSLEWAQRSQNLTMAQWQHAIFEGIRQYNSCDTGELGSAAAAATAASAATTTTTTDPPTHPRWMPNKDANCS